MMLIEIENLSVTFTAHGRQVRAVENVSLNVKAQESFGLVGESGSGKSTILRAICGLAPISGGTIRINGQPITHDRAFSRKVQMVFQDPYASLHPRHTIDRTLSEPLAIHGLPLTDAAITKALTDVGLPPNFRFRYPHQLSGGQRQRVAIARALMLQPEILLLDEPTSALDPISTAKIEELISELKQDYTITIVTHNMQQAARCSDYTAYMYLGELVEFGETDQLFMNPGRKETQDYITGRFG